VPVPVPSVYGDTDLQALARSLLASNTDAHAQILAGALLLHANAYPQALALIAKAEREIDVAGFRFRCSEQDEGGNHQGLHDRLLLATAITKSVPLARIASNRAKKGFRCALRAVSLSAASDTEHIREDAMALEMTFLGHAGFLFSDGRHKVVMDPFLTGNPLAKHKPSEIECGAVLLTHGHEDHIGDTLEIARNNGATVIGSHEISVWAEGEGVQAIGTNPGGKLVQDWGWAAFTQAIHSSSYQGRYMGAACGIVLSMGGVKVYHCGDTTLFSDMKMLGEIYSPDIACVPMGDRYTMDPELASTAAEWIAPKVAIPIHYKTFPILAQDASGFMPNGVEVKVLEPGESWSYG
jgi:L-ascorbate metabolism protein UlaG (beta-lactamase superfamily)